MVVVEPEEMVAEDVKAQGRSRKAFSKQGEGNPVGTRPRHYLGLCIADIQAIGHRFNRRCGRFKATNGTDSCLDCLMGDGRRRPASLALPPVLK